MDANEVIAAREKAHGDYTAQAAFSQKLKELIHRQPRFIHLEPYQKESLDMIAVKISRILHGDRFEPDHWLDIAGYATLSYERVKEEIPF